MAIALFLLDGLSPEQFLSQMKTIVADYTAWAKDNYGVEFTLAGSLKFQSVWSFDNYWFYEDLGIGLSEFRIQLWNVPQATHFELKIEGAGTQRAAVNDCIRESTLLLSKDPANFEVWLFSSEVDEVPFAIASCEGSPGDNYGRLVIHDTWSVRPTVEPASEFSVYISIAGAAYYELHGEGFENPLAKKPIGEPILSASIYFTEPSELIVRFYDSEEATEPIAIARCSGADGDKFGKLIYQ